MGVGVAMDVFLGVEPECGLVAPGVAMLSSMVHFAVLTSLASPPIRQPAA